MYEHIKIKMYYLIILFIIILVYYKKELKFYPLKFL